LTYICNISATKAIRRGPNTSKSFVCQKGAGEGVVPLSNIIATGVTWQTWHHYMLYLQILVCIQFLKEHQLHLLLWHREVEFT